MYFIDAVWFCNIFKGLFEQIENFVRMKLFMLVIRNSFCGISHCLTHFRRKVKTEFGLKDISYAAFTGLAVDADNICVIISSHICRIDRKIRNIPVIRILVISPVHTLGNCILMRAGKCGKYKCTTVRTSFAYFHSGTFFIYFTDMRHIREVKFWIYTLRIHIHTKCNNIYISGTLTVSKQSTLDSVCTCK